MSDMRDRVMDLALEQIQSQALEILQLRAMLEQDRELVRELRQENEDLAEEIDEMMEALGAAQASVEAYERMEAERERDR